MSRRLAERLRVMVLTRPEPAAGSLLEVVEVVLEAGAGAIQLRDKEAAGGDLLRTAGALGELCRRHGALLIVNDRLDVALAAGADGVHLGPEDLPVAPTRRLAPRPFLIGFSTDDPEAGRRAAEEGADYLGVGAVFGSTSKAGLGAERIGPGRVGQVLAAAGLPGVGIGGVTPANAAQVAEQGAGVAVLSVVMDAADPGEVVEALVRAVERAGRGGQKRAPRGGGPPVEGG